jgi:hypothetical protein
MITGCAKVIRVVERRNCQPLELRDRERGCGLRQVLVAS